MRVLEEIPFRLDLKSFLTYNRMRRVNSRTRRTIKGLIETILPLAKPKALYKVAYVEKREHDALHIDKVKFSSRVLRLNLDKAERVFPYIATCGSELDDVQLGSSDFMLGYYLDVIKEMALRSATSYLERHLKAKFAMTQVSRMNPGSLEDWPLTQQQHLFSLFNGVTEAIRVRLTEHCLMIPIKSVSGIYFPTQIGFESCQLCPRGACSGRRAAFDHNLAEKYDLHY